MCFLHLCLAVGTLYCTKLTLAPDWRTTSLVTVTVTFTCLLLVESCTLLFSTSPTLHTIDNQRNNNSHKFQMQKAVISTTTAPSASRLYHHTLHFPHNSCLKVPDLPQATLLDPWSDGDANIYILCQTLTHDRRRNSITHVISKDLKNA